MFLRHLVSSWIRQQAQGAAWDAVSQVSEPTSQAANQSSADAASPPTRCATVIFFALPIEAGGLLDMLSGWHTTQCSTFNEHLGRLDDRLVCVAETGVGQQAAGRAARDAIALHEPAWVVSAGFAGGLHPDLKRGDMLMADRVADAAGNAVEMGLRVDAQSAQSQPDLHVGKLLTVDAIVETPDEKRRLVETHAALAVDMETLAIARVCQETKTRLLSIRVISDGVSDRLPPEVAALVKQTTWAGKLGAAAGAIWNRPGSVKDMWQLKEDALTASDRLAKFIRATLKQLPE